ncbi:MAG: diguanylate cyclase, partial [Pseudomonadota bacterium]
MDEATRIARLHDLRLDRIKQPEVFEKITQFATEALSCPIAAISIVDEWRERILGQTGLPIPELGRDGSFCSACLASGKPILINDAKKDPRFSQNALVQRRSHQRSCAAIPLTLEDGVPIAALWCASPDIGAFDHKDVLRLTTLAQLAEQCLNAHAKAIELAEANASLLQLNQLFKQAETAAQIGSWRVDIATNELHWSDQVFAIHGVPIGTQINVEVAIQYYAPEDRAHVQETIARVLEDGQPFSFEATIKRADGQLRRIRSLGERIDVNGEPSSLAGVFMDCTEEHMQTIALQRAATRDPLTGLYNRSEFDRRLVEALADPKRYGPQCAVTVLLVDLDGFKSVNDRLGHLFGDRLLVQLAQALDKGISGNSFVARWGGDEFALLFPPGCCLEEAKGQAELLIADLSKQVQIGEKVIHVSATCGLAEMRDGAAAEELMRRADLALYHGKANGRGSAH